MILVASLLWYTQNWISHHIATWTDFQKIQNSKNDDASLEVQLNVADDFESATNDESVHKEDHTNDNAVPELTNDLFFEASDGPPRDQLALLANVASPAELMSQDSKYRRASRRVYAVRLSTTSRELLCGIQSQLLVGGELLHREPPF